jgi:5-methyltetrahydrofolate--homocysteine methyltransferase
MIIISGTITDARAARCQDNDRSVLNRCATRDRSLSANCALGAKQLRPYIEELSRIADIYVSAYPNAGLPNAFGDTTGGVRDRGAIREFATNGFVNIVGSCR